MISTANISATSYTQYNNVLEPILSSPRYISPSITFADDVVFTNGDTNDELIFDITELNSHKFDNYKSFSTCPSVGPFVPNYVYATTHDLISNSSSISAVASEAYTIASLVCYSFNVLSGHNLPADVNKLRRFFLLNPDVVMMKTIETTTQLGGSNQRLQKGQSHKSFPCSSPHQHKDDVINNLLSTVWSHDGNIAIELIVGTRTLLMDLYDIVSKSGLNVANFIQDRFRNRGIPINIWSDNVKEHFMGSVRKLIWTYGLGSKQSESHKQNHSTS